MALPDKEEQVIRPYQASVEDAFWKTCIASKNRGKANIQ